MNDQTNTKADEENADFFKGSSQFIHCNTLVVLLGDAGVGKTYLMNSYVRGSAPTNNVPTIGQLYSKLYNIIIGIEFATKTITLPDGGKVKAQIWDTAGQERYRGITNTFEKLINLYSFSHFRKAEGALVVYDITKERTFENLERWISELKQQAHKNVIIFVVGNKLDLIEKNPQLRKVDYNVGQGFSQKNGAHFLETSAQKGTNVSSCFEKLIQGQQDQFNLMIEIYHLKNTYEVDENDKNSIKLKAEKDRKVECNCNC